MSEISIRAILDYLRSTGWKESGSGSAGTFWTKGAQEAVVPNNLEEGSNQWRILAANLARANDQGLADVMAFLGSAIERYRSTEIFPELRKRVTPGRVEMELHLDGATARNHETNAYLFGRLVSHAADSVKELVKSDRGLQKHSRSLVVVGGPKEGSVTVTLREPEYTYPNSLHLEPVESVEGRALVAMAGIFSAADRDALELEPDQLRSHLTTLTLKARLEIARLAEVIDQGGWSISGSIRRGDGEASIFLGPQGSRLLGRVARDNIPVQQEDTILGTLDGWLWSRSELIVERQNGRSIHVAVPIQLQAEVAELVSEHAVAVIRVGVYSEIATGSQDAIRTAYTLRSVERNEQEPLDESLR